MTVKELKEKLDYFDNNLVVVLGYQDSLYYRDYDEVVLVTSESVTYENNVYDRITDKVVVIE